MTMRLDKLRARLAEEKLDALLVGRLDNQLYLSGFAGGEDGGGENIDSLLLISADMARVATDSRYWEAAEEAARGFSLVKITRGEYGYAEAIRDFAAEAHAHTIGFEADHVPVTRFKAWQKGARKAGARLKPTRGLVERLRAVKDESELEHIRRATRLTDAAFEHFRRQARPGMTEKQAAWLIEAFVREQGGEALAFDLIVASGPNAARPHAVPTERAFEMGEPITVDLGARLDGYNSDLTRTVCLGEPGDKFQEVYRTVLKAQEAVEKKTRAGTRGKQADAFARRVIEKAGYGEYFGHGLGHGVGLAVHELPRAGKLSKDVLEENMTLTVEPGIYLPGWGGVRIEDLVVIRKDGVEILSQATKEPRVEVDGS